MEKTTTSKLHSLHCSCREVERDLDAYLSGDLCATEARTFERHIGACEDCAGLVEDFREIKSIAATLADEPVPSSVSQRLRAHLSTELGIRFRDQKPSLSLVK